MTDSRQQVRIQQADSNVDAEVAALRAGDGRVGAVCAFVGTVRDAAGAVQAIELEHYPGMTERAIAAMTQAARARFGILGARVVHRVGRLAAGERIVLVATAAAHRRAAFEACEYLMDALKTQAPFWKKEYTAQGAAHWVDARAADDEALARWGEASANVRSSSTN